MPDFSTFELSSFQGGRQYQKNSEGKQTDKIHSQFTKVQLPPTNEVRVLELTRLYFLIKQIHSRYQFRVNGRTTDSRKAKQLPKNFELSIEKIMIKGKYNSKPQVWRLVNQLENIGLIKLKRGQSYGNCNQYTLLPFFLAKWNRIDVSKRAATFTQRLDNILTDRIFTKKKTKKLTLHRKPLNMNKTKAEASQLNTLFQSFLNSGLQDILVNDALLSWNYKTDAPGKRRKVMTSQYSKILVYCLNDKELRNILFTRFSPSNFLISKKESCFFDYDLMTYSRDRYHYFQYDEVTLVETGGNYQVGMFLRSKYDINTSIAVDVNEFNYRRRVQMNEPVTNYSDMVTELVKCLEGNGLWSV